MTILFCFVVVVDDDDDVSFVVVALFCLVFVLWFLLAKLRLSLFHACVKNAMKVTVACVVG